MMQTTDLRERDDLAGTEWLYRAALRTILVEREMRSRFVVIVKVGRQHTAQVTLTEDDDVIETLAAHRANDALDVGVLPRRARCRNDLLDFHRLEAITEDRTIRCVAVPQQISRCCVPGKRLGHLMRQPN